MHEIIESKGVPIKAWTEGVPVEPEARRQLNADEEHQGLDLALHGETIHQ